MRTDRKVLNPKKTRKLVKKRVKKSKSKEIKEKQVSQVQLKTLKSSSHSPRRSTQPLVLEGGEERKSKASVGNISEQKPVGRSFEKTLSSELPKKSVLRKSSTKIDLSGSLRQKVFSNSMSQKKSSIESSLNLEVKRKK